MFAVFFSLSGLLLADGFVSLPRPRKQGPQNGKSLNDGKVPFQFFSSPSAASSDNFSFDEMSGLIKRLDNLESSAPDILLGFFEPHLSSFSVKPGSSDQLSITSTCYSLLAIQTSSIYDASVTSRSRTEENNNAGNDSLKSGTVCLPNVIKALLASTWREDDLFQVPLLLYTVLRLDQDRSMIHSWARSNEEGASKIRQLITAVLTARPKRRAGERQVYSDYITYQVCRSLALLQESTDRPTSSASQDQQAQREGDFVADFSSDELGVGGLPANAVPDGAAGEISLGLARCAEVASNELCRQLAYRTAGDSTSFDVIRLAYSLLTYVRSTQSLTGVAGRELIPGQGVSPGTQVTPLNKRIVLAALDAFFAEQHSNDGLWDKGQPIYQSFRRQGRNVGNAFVFPALIYKVSVPFLLYR